MKTEDLEAQLLALAQSLAIEAGDLAMTMREAAIGSTQTKSSPTDPVTAADRAAEELIVDAILAQRPQDGIVGEEGASRVGASGVIWYIDPIDGTTNFIYGIPAYGVSIAAAIDDEIVVGVVTNPVLGEVYSARRGTGAFLNGERILVTSTTELATALVATGFGYRPDVRAQQALTVARVLPVVRDIRRMGSAALDLCSLAAGRVDAYYEAGLNSWDYAAGLLIATEAGALAQTPAADREDSPLVAASPAIFDALKLVLQPS